MNDISGTRKRKGRADVNSSPYNVSEPEKRLRLKRSKPQEDCVLTSLWVSGDPKGVRVRRKLILVVCRVRAAHVLPRLRYILISDGLLAVRCDISRFRALLTRLKPSKWLIRAVRGKRCMRNIAVSDFHESCVGAGAWIKYTAQRLFSVPISGTEINDSTH